MISLREGARLRTGAEGVGIPLSPMQGTSWQRCSGSIQETSTPEPPTPGGFLTPMSITSSCGWMTGPEQGCCLQAVDGGVPGDPEPRTGTWTAPKTGKK